MKLKNIRYLFKKKNIDLSIGENKKKIIIYYKGNKYKDFNFYPNSSGKKKFINSIFGWIKKRYKFPNLNKFGILPTLGNRDGLFTSFLFFSKYKKIKIVAFCKPFYQMYKKISIFFKKKIVFINTRNIYEDLKKKIKKNKIDLLILCNPNNPTGKIIKKKN